MASRHELRSRLVLRAGPDNYTGQLFDVGCGAVIQENAWSGARCAPGRTRTHDLLLRRTTVGHDDRPADGRMSATGCTCSSHALPTPTLSGLWRSVRSDLDESHPPGLRGLRGRPSGSARWRPTDAAHSWPSRHEACWHRGGTTASPVLTSTTPHRHASMRQPSGGKITRVTAHKGRHLGLGVEGEQRNIFRAGALRDSCRSCAAGWSESRRR
jgi:hypothetical protein